MLCIAQIPDGRWEVGYHFEAKSFWFVACACSTTSSTPKGTHYLNGGDWNHPELD